MNYDYEYFKAEVYKLTTIDLNLYKERQMKRRIDTLIEKYGSLSNKERSIMNKHTEYGREILGSIDTEFMKIAAEIASEHHERYDGSGYNKKSGEEINIYARIVAVADVFDALTTRRSYKEAWSVDDAVNAINQDSGKNFDPTVVAAFNNIVGSLKENISE